jgi:hypothetical protein
MLDKNVTVISNNHFLPYSNGQTTFLHISFFVRASLIKLSSLIVLYLPFPVPAPYGCPYCILSTCPTIQRVMNEIRIELLMLEFIMIFAKHR